MFRGSEILKVHKSRVLGTIPRMETCSYPKPSLCLRRRLCFLLSSCGWAAPHLKPAQCIGNAAFPPRDGSSPLLLSHVAP